MSDREKGIENSVDENLPFASHSFCALHIERNMLTKYKSACKGKLIVAASSLEKDKFEKVLEEMKILNASATDYVKSIPFKNWASCYFPCGRYGHVTSNISESLNSWISDVRDNSHFGIIKALVEKTMTLFSERRDEAKNFVGEIPKKSLLKLNNNIELGKTREVKKSSDNIYQVEDSKGDYKIVDLLQKTCTCKAFQEFKFPCLRACAVCLECDLPMNSLMEESYSNRSIKKLYNYVIYPIDFSKVEQDKTKIAPEVAKKRGRPKKVRIKSAVEGLGEKSKVVCSQCHQIGHNKRTCAKRKR